MAGTIVRTMVVGTWLGFTLSQIGFSDYDQLHLMFTFQDMRMLFTFVGAVIIGSMGFHLLAKIGRRPKVHRPIHKGTILGGVFFGAGWALSGGCPAVPLVQLGEGTLPALVTAAGLVIGVVLFQWVQRRHLNWDTGSCLH